MRRKSQDQPSKSGKFGQFLRKIKAKNDIQAVKNQPLSFHYSTLRKISQVLMLILSVFGLFLMQSQPVLATEVPQNQIAARSTANVESFFFEDFTADYYLSRDADGKSRLRVVEQLTAIFPSSDQNHGIKRIIPYTNQNGLNLTMPSDSHLDISIQENGKSIKANKIESENGYFTVYIGDESRYVHGKVIYTLEYEFTNVVTDFGQFQELYWDTNGNDWRQTFSHLTARVHFEGDDVERAYEGQQWCYVGKYGANNSSRCEISQLDDGLEFQVDRLASHENLTFDIQFAGGTFTMPEPSYDYRYLLLFGFIALGAIIIVFLSIRLWRNVRERRKFYKGYFVKPEYLPPSGVTVAEAAEIYMGNTPGDARVATLLDLAVNHKIELIDTSEKDTKKKQWKVKVLTSDLNREQITILKLLDGGKRGSIQAGMEIEIKKHAATTTTQSLINSFAQTVKDELKAKGYLVGKTPAAKATPSSDNPKAEPKTKTASSGSASTLAVFTVIWGIIGMVFIFNINETVPSYRIAWGELELAIASFLLNMVAIITGLAVSIYCAGYDVRTLKGLELSRYLDGLKLYIKMAEADRLSFLQSVDGADVTHQGIVKLYEKLLPYAVIFKLEKSWLKELSKYYEYADVSTPNWYHSTHAVNAFIAADFISALNSASSAASSSFAHSSTSGSSSGFSGGGGGGFSGGGGGGGGGGGW